MWTTAWVIDGTRSVTRMINHVKLKNWCFAAYKFRKIVEWKNLIKEQKECGFHLAQKFFGRRNISCETCTSTKMRFDLRTIERFDSTCVRDNTQRYRTISSSEWPQFLQFKQTACLASFQRRIRQRSLKP